MSDEQFLVAYPFSRNYCSYRDVHLSRKIALQIQFGCGFHPYLGWQIYHTGINERTTYFRLDTFTIGPKSEQQGDSCPFHRDRRQGFARLPPSQRVAVAPAPQLYSYPDMHALIRCMGVYWRSLSFVCARVRKMKYPDLVTPHISRSI